MKFIVWIRHLAIQILRSFFALFLACLGVFVSLYLSSIAGSACLLCFAFLAPISFTVLGSVLASDARRPLAARCLVTLWGLVLMLLLSLVQNTPHWTKLVQPPLFTLLSALGAFCALWLVQISCGKRTLQQLFQG